MKGILAAMLLAAAAPAAAQGLWALNSPDGHNTIGVARLEDGRLVWRVIRDQYQVIADSPLGLRRADQDFTTGLRFVEVSEVRAIDDSYSTPAGKRRDHHVVGRELTLTFATAAGAKLQIVLRAHDDGVAFRYRFPETDSHRRTVVAEQTGFHLPDGSKAWVMPQQEVHKYGPAYEDFYMAVPAGTSSARPDGWAFPALFKTPAGKWVLITESASRRQLLRLAPRAGRAVAASIASGSPTRRKGSASARSNPSRRCRGRCPGAWSSSATPAGRVARIRSRERSRAAVALTATRAGSSRGARPGAGGRRATARSTRRISTPSPTSPRRWAGSTRSSTPTGTSCRRGKIEDVIAHAKAKDVGLLFWYNSGGPHNDVTEAPRDRMLDRDIAAQRSSRS